jgi:hypothetical protein
MSGLGNREYGLGIRRADHATPSIRKELAPISPTIGDRSVTQAMVLVNLVSYLRLDIPRGLFYSDFPTKIFSY